ncbi:MAG: hypothetical protein JXB49_11100 [Bacteroidales bacterium]|nr:hypothetical protein [Bacteroidales bacterium]
MLLYNNLAVSKIPVTLRHYLGLLPEDLNPFLGRSYVKYRSFVKEYNCWDQGQREQFVLRNIKDNVEHAYVKIPFYHDLYDKHKFKPSDLKTFRDIKKIPVISKKLLLECPVERRCWNIQDALKYNTGGSSGHTLSFYKEKGTSPYHEIVHMNTIWEKIGYNNSDSKLVMNGQNNVVNDVDFCFKTNSLRLDIYKGFSQTARKLKKILKNIPIRFLHGYPSTIYEFALYCDAYDHEMKGMLRKSLKGAFLGSEYPHSLYRDKIEDIFNIDTVNWYGHTEGAVLAWEQKEKYRYFPFQTYGFAEINDEGHLIATTYYEKASPFIRYDTEDIISDPEIINGFLISFRILEGRNSEFVVDKRDMRISLTGLIFGRHHKIFDYCTHIQICQEEKGKAIVLYVPKNFVSEFTPEFYFDKSNIEIDFTFKKLDCPIRTRAGKLNLLVKPEQLGS